MADNNELVGTTEPLIISPEEAAKRLQQRTKPVPDGGKGGKYNISRAEAVSIAAQIGQQVYDEIRKEHAMTMELLQNDLQGHFAEIKNIVALNILDIQRRSFSYRIRRDFVYDCQRFGRWIASQVELAKAYYDLWIGAEPPSDRAQVPADPQSAIAGSIRGENTEPIEQAFDTDVEDIIEAPDIAQSLELHVGAPTELPEGHG